MRCTTNSCILNLIKTFFLKKNIYHSCNMIFHTFILHDYLLVQHTIAVLETKYISNINIHENNITANT